MRIYEDHINGQNRYRSQNTCSYCRKSDHDVRTCPEAPKDWEEGWKHHTVPIKTTNLTGWKLSPKYWGEWFLKCKAVVEKQEKLKLKEKQPKARRSLKDIHCGFCGERGHTRKHCPEMKVFIERAHIANRKWMKEAWNYLHNVQQIRVGGLVNVLVPKSGSSYYDKNYVNKVATIVSISYHDMTLGCSDHYYGQGYEGADMRSGLTIKILVDGEVKKMTSSDAQRSYSNGNDGKELLDRNIFSTGCLDTHYNSPIFNGVLSAVGVDDVNKAVTEEFLTQTNAAFDFVARKRTLERLEKAGLTESIDRWFDY